MTTCYKKEKFILSLKGKSYGGRFLKFDPETGTGKDLVMYEDNGWTFHTVYCMFPLHHILYCDDNFLVTTEKYYDIGYNGEE